MKHRSSRYPLGTLLVESLYGSKLSIQTFVLAIGYGNPTKGIRAFDRILRWGYPDDVFMERLLSSELSPPKEKVQAAVEETLTILREEAKVARAAQKEAERVAFKPFFQAVPESRQPCSISLFAFTGGASRYTRYLPASFPSWPLEEQHTYIKQQVVAHFESSQGRTLYQGRIIAYRLFRWYDHPPLLLSISGEPLGTDSGTPVPEATVTVGSRTLSAEVAQKIFKMS